MNTQTNRELIESFNEDLLAEYSAEPFAVVKSGRRVVLTSTFPLNETQASYGLMILKELSDRKFFLRHDLQIFIEDEPDGYILSNESLDVHAFGKTIEAAQQEWQDVLIDLYLSYRDTPDDQLTESGKGLKDELLKTVGERNGN